jgi:hypothetical protein
VICDKTAYPKELGRSQASKAMFEEHIGYAHNPKLMIQAAKTELMIYGIDEEVFLEFSYVFDCTKA